MSALTTQLLTSLIHRKVFEELQRDSKGPLFHYTSQDGFLGILKSKALWATDISYLNDSRENRIATDHVLSVLDEARAVPNPSPFLMQFSEQVRSVASKVPGIRRFVISFSEKGDLLSQWRAYCPNGAGFSIGFTREQVWQRFLSFPGALFKCEYDLARQRDFVKELFAVTFGEFEQSEGKEFLADVPANKSVFSFIFNVGIIAPAFKDPAFAEEQEWRFVSGEVPLTNCRFRPGKSMLTPYCEVPLCGRDDQLNIEKIYAGPSPHMELAVQSARQFSESCNVRVNKGIVPSRVPYRAW